MEVPFVDLGPQTNAILDSVLKQIRLLAERAEFVLGPQVEQFEREFAAFCNSTHCVGVGNGGDAIEILLLALDLEPGSEVIMPANTFTATAMATLRAGYVPVIVDVTDDTYMLDPSAIEEAISSQTRVVIPVHLYGQMGPMEEYQRIAQRNGLYLLEDAAQSHGATHGSLGMGAFGIGAATSFYPGKNLGAFGDAGGVLTNSSQIADNALRIRNYGGIEKYEHSRFGLNSRLDSVQAIVLTEKLKHLNDWTAQRQHIAMQYKEELRGHERLILPGQVPDSNHVWHLFVVRVPERDRVRLELAEGGIATGIHYPVPLHLQPALSQLKPTTRSVETSERHALEVLSLPMYPGMTESMVTYVCDQLRRILAR